jgi:hypothetical protein
LLQVVDLRQCCIILCKKRDCTISVQYCASAARLERSWVGDVIMLHNSPNRCRYCTGLYNMLGELEKHIILRQLHNIVTSSPTPYYTIQQRLSYDAYHCSSLCNMIHSSTYDTICHTITIATLKTTSCRMSPESIVVVDRPRRRRPSPPCMAAAAVVTTAAGAVDAPVV